MFKVGDRVRLVSEMVGEQKFGDEGVVTGLSDKDYYVVYDRIKEMGEWLEVERNLELIELTGSISSVGSTYTVKPSNPKDAISQNYKHEDFTKIVDSTIVEMRKLIELKGGEYAGDVDRLANFRRNGERLGLSMESVWAVYAGKHIDAVFQYVMDLQTGKTRERLEPIEGRVDDIIVYMLLFKAILDERNKNVQ